METWFIIVVSLSISALLKSLLSLLFISKSTTHKLPPGPFTFPIIGNFLWLSKSLLDLESYLRSLHSKFGPIVTLHIGTRRAIFIADRSLAHQALVRNGAIFADRPPASGIEKINNSNHHSVSSAFYGPTWRLLRRNITIEILHPSRVRSFSHARNWVLQVLKERLDAKARNGAGTVIVKDHFQYAMFCLLVLMCFGDKLDEDQIKRIEDTQRRYLLSLGRFRILSFWPKVTKIVFSKRWDECLQIRRNKENIFIPLIRARKELKQERLKKINQEKHGEYFLLSYVDTLLNLQLPDEERSLEESEIVTLCSEFLSAGTDTTTTALQWIMANMVKYPHIQEKLYEEIRGVVGDREEVIEEKDLQSMPYLKAIILEGLRRHPPAHLVAPHAVTEDIVLDKYLVPKNGSINFMIAEMGWDPKVWKDPKAFRPERFMSVDRGGDGEEVDITGSREIRMIPFGSGRRICPGYNLAMFHLEYFVANLVWSYEWKAIKGDEVDLSEKQELTTVMKNPLQAHITPRSKYCQC